jgi:hypothetical protein
MKKRGIIILVILIYLLILIFSNITQASTNLGNCSKLVKGKTDVYFKSYTTKGLYPDTIAVNPCIKSGSDGTQGSEDIFHKVGVNLNACPSSTTDCCPSKSTYDFCCWESYPKVDTELVYTKKNIANNGQLCDYASANDGWCSEGQCKSEAQITNNCADGNINNNKPCKCEGVKTTGLCYNNKYADTTCEEGQITTTCACGTTVYTNNGYCYSKTWRATSKMCQNDVLIGVSYTESCDCEGQTRTTQGYCYGYGARWVTSRCTEGQTITTPCACEGDKRTDGYCINGKHSSNIPEYSTTTLLITTITSILIIGFFLRKKK